MRNTQAKKLQTGVVLIISLLIMLVMSLIAITSIQSTTLEERMAGNSRDQLTAFEAAEVALTAGENLIDSGTLALSAFDTDGSDGLYDNTSDHIWNDINWNTSSIQHSAFLPSEIKTSPRYVIQHIGTVEPNANRLNLGNYGQGVGGAEIELFRVTSRGTGGTDAAVVHLESVYGSVF